MFLHRESALPFEAKTRHNRSDVELKISTKSIFASISKIEESSKKSKTHID